MIVFYLRDDEILNSVDTVGLEQRNELGVDSGNK